MVDGQSATPSRGQRVLVVDDDRNLTALLAAILKSGGLEVVSAPNGDSALDLLTRETIDALILDLRMPGMDGRTLFREIRARGHDFPIMIASAYGARSAQQELGAQGAIEKPFEPEKLLDSVQRLLR